MISRLDGAEVRSVVTDDRGRYAVTLPAGDYRVTTDAVRPGFTRDLPATVNVLPGRETRLDVRIDTGIR